MNYPVWRCIWTVYAILMLAEFLHGGETFPLRSPQRGEARPHWWLCCWYSQVIVLEGSLKFRQAPDVIAGLADQIPNEVLPIEERGKPEVYGIGEIMATKVHFLAGDPTVHNFKDGSTIKFLVRLKAHNGELISMFFESETDGFFIFERTNILGASIQLLLVAEIPPEAIDSATAIFELRRHQDHTRVLRGEDPPLPHKLWVDTEGPPVF